MHIHALSLAALETLGRVFAGAIGRRPVRLLWIAAVLAGAWSSVPAIAERSPPVAPTFREGLLEGPIEPFVPKQPPTEADRDRQEAVALAGAGYAHKERGEFRQALRMYQRALRLDPKLHDVAQMVVLLAHALDQDDVAVRYLKMTDPADDDPGLLQDLGNEMVERDDLAGAATLLERALAAQKARRKTTRSSVCACGLAGFAASWNNTRRLPTILPT